MRTQLQALFSQRLLSPIPRLSDRDTVVHSRLWNSIRPRERALAHKLARSRRAFEDESRERLDLAFKRFLACVSTQIGRRQRKPAGERLDYLQRIVAYLHEVEHARAHKRIRLVIAMAPEQGPDRVDPCLILLPHDSADFRRNA